MEVTRVYYNDDGILIPGHLIRRKFRKPVFYPVERKCGFDDETISDEELIVGYSQEAYRRFYKDTYPEGTRILLIEMKNDPRPIPAGTKGTVDSVDNVPTNHCRFDNGRYFAASLLSFPGKDFFYFYKAFRTEYEFG